MDPKLDPDKDLGELQQRRAAARRTALMLALVALLIFGVFMLTGITGR